VGRTNITKEKITLDKINFFPPYDPQMDHLEQVGAVERAATPKGLAALSFSI